MIDTSLPPTTHLPCCLCLTKCHGKVPCVGLSISITAVCFVIPTRIRDGCNEVGFANLACQLQLGGVTQSQRQRLTMTAPPLIFETGTHMVADVVIQFAFNAVNASRNNGMVTLVIAPRFFYQRNEYRANNANTRNRNRVLHLMPNHCKAYRQAHNECATARFAVPNSNPSQVQPLTRMPNHFACSLSA